MTAMIAAEICAACGHVSLEQRGFCNRCGSRDVAPDNIAGIGRLWSQSIIYRPPSAESGSAEPYTIGLVALDAGPRIMAVIPPDLQIGDAVMVDRPEMSGAPVTHKAC